MPQCCKSTTKKKTDKKRGLFFNIADRFSVFFVLTATSFGNFLFQKGIIIVFSTCAKRLNKSNA